MASIFVHYLTLSAAYSHRFAVFVKTALAWCFAIWGRNAYKSGMDLITSTHELRALCDKVAQSSYMTVDTEFMRERTFWPIVCLIQVATPDIEAMIDPMADSLDLAPFFDLLKNADIVKVMHGCKQDIEIFYNMAGIIPAPLFDTQIAAMVCGFGDAVGYETLIRRTTGAQISKANRFTDWSCRPLSAAQLEYALSDVTLLRGAYETLLAQIEKSGRRSWLDEELTHLTNPENYDQNPEHAWKRFKLANPRPRVFAVLMEIAKWRDSEAQKRDVPRGRILKDNAVRDLALHAPRDLQALSRMRSIPRGFEKSPYSAPLLRAIEIGRKTKPEDLPTLPEPSVNRPGTAALLALLKVLLKQCSDESQVAPKLIASVDDLERIANDDAPNVSALTGWRHDIFGQYALALKRGELALASEDNKVVLIKRK